MSDKVNGSAGRPVDDFRAFGDGFSAFPAGAGESARHLFGVVIHVFVVWFGLVGIALFAGNTSNIACGPRLPISFCQ